MEKDLEKKFIKHVKTLGLRTAKFIDQSRKGAPDRIVFFPKGKIIFFELKVKNNVLSEHQKDYHALLRGEGHIVFTIRDFESAKRILNTLYIDFARVSSLQCRA
jgi:hypothetical protein